MDRPIKISLLLLVIPCVNTISTSVNPISNFFTLLRN